MHQKDIPSLRVDHILIEHISSHLRRRRYLQSIGTLARIPSLWLRVGIVFGGLRRRCVLVIVIIIGPYALPGLLYGRWLGFDSTGIDRGLGGRFLRACRRNTWLRLRWGVIDTKTCLLMTRGGQGQYIATTLRRLPDETNQKSLFSTTFKIIHTASAPVRHLCSCPGYRPRRFDSAQPLSIVDECIVDT